MEADLARLPSGGEESKLHVSAGVVSSDLGELKGVWMLMVPPPLGKYCQRAGAQTARAQTLGSATSVELQINK